MNGLPESWIKSSVLDCCEIFDNKRIPVNSSERNQRIDGKKTDDLFPYYGATGQVGYIDNYIFDEELVLLGEDGAPFFDFRKDIAFIINGKTWVNNHAHVLKAKPLTTNKFVRYYLNTFDFKGFVTGTTRYKLNQSKMKEIPVPLPPLPEQHRIVEKIEELFSKLDAGVKELVEAKTQLKRYRQSVLKSAVEGKLTEEWRKEHRPEPADKLLERIQEERKAKLGKKYKEPAPVDTTELPELPDGWVWSELDNISLKITDGEHIRPKTVESGIPFLSAKDVRENGVIFDNKLFISEEDAKQFRNRCNPEENDILIVSRGASVGRTCKVDTDKIFCLLGSVILIKPTKLISPKLLMYLIKSSTLQKSLVGLSGSTAQQAIYIRDIRNVVIPLVPFDEQNQIVQEIDRIFSIIDGTEQVIELELKRAQSLRQSILKRAFEGKLVPQDPTDEPASELLERIKKEKD